MIAAFPSLQFTQAVQNSSRQSVFSLCFCWLEKEKKTVDGLGLDWGYSQVLGDALVQAMSYYDGNIWHFACVF